MLAENDNALVCEKMEASLAGPAAAGATKLDGHCRSTTTESAVNVVYHCITRRA